MPLFKIIGRDGPEGATRRKDHRPEHLAHMDELDAQGKVRWGGPLMDEAGNPQGSVIILECADLAEAKAIAASDPYVTHGIFGSYEVFSTIQVYPKP